jgi:branched-chain amino acid transport system permease protein
LPPIISALGAAFILESVARNLYGASYQVYPQSVEMPGRFGLLGTVTASTTQSIALIASFVLMTLLYVFVNYTRTGTAMRAVSLDHDTSRLMGIDVNRIIGIVFFLGPALGGAAGVLVALHYGSFNYTLGWTFGLKAFIAAILGGIGNIPGAMLGGIILGVVESMGAVYLGSQWKDVIAYVILVLILIVRPTGILGERVAEKL